MTAANQGETRYRHIGEVIQLQMYHHYKYQRATKHLRDLYEAYRAGSLEDAEKAICRIKVINSRIRELNEENRLSIEFGIIDYGSFLYGWEGRQGTAYMKRGLEDLCRRKRYVKGWSCLPPQHDFRYFEEPISYPGQHQPVIWDILSPWLQVLWNLHKNCLHQPFIGDCELQILDYAKNGGFSVHCDRIRHHYHALRTLFVALKEMAFFLKRWQMRQDAAFSACEYGIRREEMRRVCEFEGLPIAWIPDKIAIEGQGYTKVRISG
ncbi:uncharacterized protein BP01DRAFT_361093 [Aspergillus saccharolyticus JOP 1030-1]|uniref:Uncharacterized protein n=1 Tax=Aspergillus saccharolyticus JOP 1030-1 TaxID=1450539 RepID=A0A318ZK03_9EURO|nr:hypothetical protein BP01DRAFT_361093 [Aspergillus saccharolyticus JOP 1030-1]PYH40588.1 hypothetical protein BP01DRAFT_361093 [Aspergillus saccharolyticus JOP 1030-1]